MLVRKLLLALAALLTPQVRGDEYAEITSRLCDACEDIWLRAFPPADTANNTKAVDAKDANGAALRCFGAVESACADCKETLSGCPYNMLMIHGSPHVKDTERRVVERMVASRGEVERVVEYGVDPRTLMSFK